jgi:hydroxymethylglutaryl-CoA synthase
LAVYEATYSFVTDTPDFWRRPHEMYPSHGDRFTGEPAYFKHVIAAGEALMEELGAKPGDFKYAQVNIPEPAGGDEFRKSSVLTGLGRR